METPEALEIMESINETAIAVIYYGLETMRFRRNDPEEDDVTMDQVSDVIEKVMDQTFGNRKKTNYGDLLQMYEAAIRWSAKELGLFKLEKS